MKSVVVQHLRENIRQVLYPVREPDFLAWEHELFDNSRWRPSTVARRCLRWVNASRRRRWVVWSLVALFVLVVLPITLGAVATAQTTSVVGGTEPAVTSTNNALSWMQITDTSGVPLSNYVFATNHGSLLHPQDTALSLVLGLEFAGWMVIVTTAIWLIGYALSFKWLNMFGTALVGVANSLTGQIATSAVLITCAAIGAFFVAYFITRGFHAKATMQVATMLVVAIIGPLYLAHPLADALSSDGMLAQGRNLGISVAAGLNGTDTTDPTTLVTTMQGELADNFARHPLQVWNFGHVVDDSPACKAAWSSGTAAANEDQVENGMKNCGDSAAYASASNPSVGQMGAGIILIFAGTILLIFGAYLAIRVIRAALATIWYGMQSIIGFAGSGFIFGPPQIFLVRSIVDGFVAGGEMALYVIFTGGYVLFMGDLFQQAGGQVMAVFIIGGVVEIIAILQLKRLAKSLERGNEWIVNRVGLAIQGSSDGGGSGGGGGGGRALGMGAAGSGNSMRALQLVTTLGALNTLGDNPLMEWVAGGTPNWMHPLSRLERNQAKQYGGFWRRKGMGGPDGYYAQNYMNRIMYSEAASLGAAKYGGVDTALGAASAIQSVRDKGGSLDVMWGALTGAGFKDEKIMRNAIRSWGIVEQNSADYILSDKRLGYAVASMQRLQTSTRRFAEGDPNQSADEVAADLAAFQTAAFRYHRALRYPVSLDNGAATGPERQFAEAYVAAPSKKQMTELLALADGPASGVGTGALAGITGHGAQRIRTWIGNEHAKEVFNATTKLVADPADYQKLRDAREALVRAQRSDSYSGGASLTPANALQPPNPGNNTVPRNWARMAQVNNLMRRRP